MFYKRRSLGYACLCAFLFLSLLVGGCEHGSDEPCTEAELQHIEDPAPFATIVNRLTPTIAWLYDDSSCYPDHFHIAIYDRDIIRSPNDYDGDYPRPIFTGQTEGRSYPISAEAGLQRATTYFVVVTVKTAEEGGGPSTIWWFTIGPPCHRDTTLYPPILEYPPDGAEMYFPESVNLEWDNQLPCWPPGDFYLEISTTEDFSATIWRGVSHNREVAWISDGPPRFADCTRYYWHVHADPEGGGGTGPVSETWSFVLNWNETPCGLPLDLPDLDIPPVGSWIPPTATVIENASCRSGPTLDYPIVDYLAVGQTAQVDGRNDDSSWLYILSPNLQLDCWISALLVEVSDDLDGVGVVEAAPPPSVSEGGQEVPEGTEEIPTTEAPFDCTQFNTNPNACNASQYCVWDSSVPPNGTCINR